MESRNSFRLLLMKRLDRSVKTLGLESYLCIKVTFKVSPSLVVHLGCCMNCNLAHDSLCRHVCPTGFSQTLQVYLLFHPPCVPSQLCLKKSEETGCLIKTSDFPHFGCGMVTLNQTDWDGQHILLSVLQTWKLKLILWLTLHGKDMKLYQRNYSTWKSGSRR